MPDIRNLGSAFASVGGHRLHYWLGGPEDGTPVVLCHGFLGTGYVWRDVAPALVDAGCRVLVVDLLGYGDSDKPAGTAGYDARALGGLLRALANEVAPTTKQRLLVAHDMGAPPALLWAADHPDEIGALVYLDEPVMIGERIRSFLRYTPEAMSTGSLWWWILPLAPGVPEALVVGREEQFLRWFYDGGSRVPAAFPPDIVAEYLRTFSGAEGVLGSMGVYRAAFTSIEQTEPLQQDKITVPVVGVGGEFGLGAGVGEMLRLVADDVTTITIDGVGHFVPEEAPDRVVDIVTDLIDEKETA